MNINKEDIIRAVETISTGSYEHGKSLGIRLAAEKILKLAGEEFKKENDELSFLLRSVYKEMIKYSEETENKWCKEFSDPVSLSWDVVDKIRIE